MVNRTVVGGNQIPMLRHTLHIRARGIIVKYLSVCLSVYGTPSATGPCFGAGSTPMQRLFVWSRNALQPDNTNNDSVGHFQTRHGYKFKIVQTFNYA